MQRLKYVSFIFIFLYFFDVRHTDGSWNGEPLEVPDQLEWKN
jgi:hypothetical protein